MPRTTQASFDARKSINSGYLKKNRPKPPHAGKGRKPGVKNVVTQTVREMFAEFVHHNAANVQSLFDRVSKKDAYKALQIYNSMADFVLPRLARTEMNVTGDPLVSLNVTDPAEAAATYASIVGNTKFDLSRITFAPPHQATEASIVAEQGQVPSGPRPPDNLVGIFQRLGKE
jgi:hypothetical protein